MKVWFNKIHDSRRSVIEITDSVIHIGRDPANTIVLQSPLVSKRHAVVTTTGGRLRLENVGLNGCQVGDREVMGGESVEFEPGQAVRIWPYSLLFEAETQSVITIAQMASHLRSLMANLELKIHRKLLERLDLYELENRRAGSSDAILLLENHIEDICRELNLFGPENAPVLEEITGLTLHDYLTNQLILEGGRFATTAPAGLTQNEFDIPATLIAERESELQNLLRFTRDKLHLDQEPDLSARISRVESQFPQVFPLVRPHLHNELRRYLILRTLKKDLKDTVFGFGPLQDLIRAPTITEIMVVKSDSIFVERDGVLELSGRRFISDKVTESIIERIVAQVGRRIDKSQPLVDARLPDGSRVNAIIPPLAIRGPCLTIRKFPAHRYTMDDLVELQSLTPSAAMFLRACVIDRKNVLVSGGTGTGKTTMLNVLSSFIPVKERIVTIEDTTELQLHQDHVVTLETKQANVEGVGAYTIRDLVKNALRMRPDRILVGECRGAEAVDMLQAMNTGHDGSMTTVHANSSEEVIKRLEVLVLMAVDLPVVSIHRQIASALNVIVQITRMPGGRRAVTQISEVAGLDPDTHELIIHDIYNMRDGQTLRATGYLPTFVESLIQKKLLQLEFLYGREATATNGTVPVAPPARSAGTPSRTPSTTSPAQRKG